MQNPMCNAESLKEKEALRRVYLRPYSLARTHLVLSHVRTDAESLKEKDALRRAHLRGLAATLSCSPEARSSAATLAAPLGKLALEGCTKAAGERRSWLAASRQQGLLGKLALGLGQRGIVGSGTGLWVCACAAGRGW